MVQNDKKKKKKREGSDAVITLDRVSKSYSSGSPALDNVSLTDQKWGICFYRRRQRFRKIDPDQAAFAGADAHERPCYRKWCRCGALKAQTGAEIPQKSWNRVPGFPVC